MRTIDKKLDTQEMAHTLIRNILKDYPIIKSMETHEDEYKATISLDLGGFKKKEAKDA